MTKILGLDISSVSTGYCIFNNGRLIKSSIGTITPSAKLSYGERLKYFADELTSLLNRHKPDKIIIEDIYRGRNITTFKTLAMFRGVCFFIVYAIAKKNPICIMPTAARKLIGIGVTKEDGFKFAVEKYGLKKYDFELDNDKTDAIILGLAGHTMERQGLKEKDLKQKRKRKKKK